MRGQNSNVFSPRAGCLAAAAQIYVVGIIASTGILSGGSLVLVVRGYPRHSQGSVTIDVRGEDLWGEISIPRDTKATGLAISTPHGCVVVIGVDALMGGERVLIASFLDPLDPATLQIIEGASKTRRITLTKNGSIVGVLNLSEEDLGKMEYVASKTRECSKMQDKPVNIEMAAQWFMENFSI